MHSSKRVVARGDTGDRPAFHDSSPRSAAVVQAEKASTVERDDLRGECRGGRRLSDQVGAADVLACRMSPEPGAENTDRQMALLADVLRELAQAQVRRECRRWDYRLGCLRSRRAGVEHYRGRPPAGGAAGA